MYISVECTFSMNTAAPGLLHIRGPNTTSHKCCLAFHQHNGYHKLLTFRYW